MRWCCLATKFDSKESGPPSDVRAAPSQPDTDHISSTRMCEMMNVVGAQRGWGSLEKKRTFLMCWASARWVRRGEERLAGRANIPPIFPLTLRGTAVTLLLLSFQRPTSKFTSWKTASAWPRRRPSRSGSLWTLFTTRSWSFPRVRRGKWCR